MVVAVVLSHPGRVVGDESPIDPVMPLMRCLPFIAEQVEHLYVFGMPGSVLPQLADQGGKLSVHTIVELGEIIAERRIDVWHFTDTWAARQFAVVARYVSDKSCCITADSLAPFEDSEWAQSMESYDGMVVPSAPTASLAEIAVTSGTFVGRGSSGKKGKVRSIPLAVEASPVSAAAKRDARLLLGLPEEPVLILCTHPFQPSEGADILPFLATFLELKTDRKACLVVTGQDPGTMAGMFSQFLQTSARNENYVFVWPNPASKSVALLFDAADIFVSLPDLSGEALVGVTYAMAKGLAVVAPEMPPFAGTIDSGRTAMAVRCWTDESALSYLGVAISPMSPKMRRMLLSQAIVMDPDALKDSLATLIRDPGLRQQIGIAGQKWVEGHCHPKLPASSYVSFWRELMEARIPAASTGCNSRYAKLLQNQLGLALTGGIGQERLKISEFGRKVLNGGTIPLYATLQEVIHPPVIMGILQRAEANLSVEEICNQIGLIAYEEPSDAVRAGVMYHILYAIKHRLAEISVHQ